MPVRSSRPVFSALVALCTLVAIASIGCGDDDDSAAAGSGSGATGGSAGASGSGGAGGASGSGASAQSETAPYPAVDDKGVFNVGFRSFEHTYQPPGVDGPRTIKVSVWYPTNDKEGEPAVYPLIRDYDSFLDASLADPLDKKYPVHVWGHGRSAFGGIAAAALREFARHGWVGIAPDHTGDTTGEAGNPLPPEIYYLRSLDASEMLNLLDALPSDDPLSGKCKTDQALLSGHSFGTYTAWNSAGATFDTARIQERCDSGDLDPEVCAPEHMAIYEMGLRDERFAATMPLAGDGGGVDWHGETGMNNAKVPVFTMSGGDNDVGADETFARVTGVDLWWVDIAGVCHDGFNQIACNSDLDEDTWRIMNTYSLALGYKYVLGYDVPSINGILDGTTNVSDRVSFHFKAKLRRCYRSNRTTAHSASSLVFRFIRPRPAVLSLTRMITRELRGEPRRRPYCAEL